MILKFYLFLLEEVTYVGCSINTINDTYFWSYKIVLNFKQQNITVSNQKLKDEIAIYIDIFYLINNNVWKLDYS